MTNKNDEIVLTPAEDNLWYKFMLVTIEFDRRDKNNIKPDGWHWFLSLKSLLNIDIHDRQTKLHDEHPLKSLLLPSDDSAMEHRLIRIVEDFRKYLVEAKKNTVIDLSNLTFKNDANFFNFVFPMDVNFKNSEFLQCAYFTNAIFLRPVNFENARFHETPKTYKETAKFKNAVFMNTADFSETVFNAYANFKGATFSGRTIFQLAEFKYHAPRFYGAEFNNEIILNRIKLPEAKKYKENKNDTDDKLYEKRVEENKSAYETLIHLMEKQNKHHERHRFFREEMRWRQLGNTLTQKRLINAALQGDYEYYSLGKLLGNSFTIAFFWLYDTTSEYGHGIGRAFGWWLLHILVGAGFIALIAYCGGLEIGQVAFCSFAVSFANANPFVFFGFKEGGLCVLCVCMSFTTSFWHYQRSSNTHWYSASFYTLNNSPRTFSYQIINN